jgi:hypothetical protein
VIARLVSFLLAIEWFLICEPRIMPLAQAAPPPSATNNASAAMTVAGCRSCLPIRASSCTISVDPLVDYPLMTVGAAPTISVWPRYETGISRRPFNGGRGRL